MSSPSTDLVKVIERTPTAAVAPWDPFQLMDRMDEEALQKELQGIASTELVYVVRGERGQDVVGLSKAGVDECAMLLVAQGQVIREESLDYTILGEGEAREALFQVRAARYAVSPDGHEVRLDQVLGVKRQALYYDAQSLDLDSRVPSKKYKGATYREMLENEEGRGYLEWMASNFSDENIREFVTLILSGEVVSGLQGGRKLNPFWYEAGAMKAARNARFRLIPSHVRAQVIATARKAGATGDGQHQASRRVESARNVAPISPNVTAPQPAQRTEATQAGPDGPSEKQRSYYLNLVASPLFTEAEKESLLDWLDSKATRHTIRDQLAWLKSQVEKRSQSESGDARE